MLCKLQPVRHPLAGKTTILVTVPGGDTASLPSLGLSHQHRVPAFFPSPRSCCPSLTITLPLCVLRPHAHLLAQLYLPVELPDFSIVTALPGILRVTAKPGYSWTSAARTLFWSPIGQRGVTQTPLYPWTVQLESRRNRQSCHKGMNGTVGPGDLRGHLDLQHA